VKLLFLCFSSIYPLKCVVNKNGEFEELGWPPSNTGHL
jgi:hypothetical protein